MVLKMSLNYPLILSIRGNPEVLEFWKSSLKSLNSPLSVIHLMLISRIGAAVRHSHTSFNILENHDKIFKVWSILELSLNFFRWKFVATLCLFEMSQSNTLLAVCIPFINFTQCIPWFCSNFWMNTPSVSWWEWTMSAQSRCSRSVSPCEVTLSSSWARTQWWGKPFVDIWRTTHLSRSRYCNVRKCAILARHAVT